MTFQVPVNLPDAPILEDSTIKEEQITINDDSDSVSSNTPCVSKSHIRQVIRKRQILRLPLNLTPLL